MRKSIPPYNLCKVQSMDDNCGEWVECMSVASGCGEQEAGVASAQASQLSRFDRETHDFEVSLTVSRPGANIILW